MDMGFTIYHKGSQSEGKIVTEILLRDPGQGHIPLTKVASEFQHAPFPYKVWLTSAYDSRGRRTFTLETKVDGEGRVLNGIPHFHAGYVDDVLDSLRERHFP